MIVGDTVGAGQHYRFMVRAGGSACCCVVWRACCCGCTGQCVAGSPTEDAQLRRLLQVRDREGAQADLHSHGLAYKRKQLAGTLAGSPVQQPFGALMFSCNGRGAPPEHARC
jgi:hypothetical protein